MPVAGSSKLTHPFRTRSLIVSDASFRKSSNAILNRIAGCTFGMNSFRSVWFRGFLTGPLFSRTVFAGGAMDDVRQPDFGNEDVLIMVEVNVP